MSARGNLPAWPQSLCAHPAHGPLPAGFEFPALAPRHRLDRDGRHRQGGGRLARGHAHDGSGCRVRGRRDAFCTGNAAHLSARPRLFCSLRDGHLLGARRHHA
eukprot:scaffold1621_cov111-Isochrysis_galbana.AAC.2